MATAACSGDEPAGPANSQPAAAIDYALAGPHPVGHRTVILNDANRDRSLRVEIWYPAAPGSAVEGEGVELFAAEGKDRDGLAAALATSPTACTSTRTNATRDAKPALDAKWPTLTFSHCHLCARFSSFSLAEHLASHGFAVVAADHTGGTMFDKIAGDYAAMGTPFLETRKADLSFLLDTMLGAGDALPDDLRGRFDGDKVGAYGHSFGSVTTGLLVQEDERVLAAAGLLAPFENLLLPGVEMSKISAPLLFFVATEDNSITEYGNKLIRENYANAGTPAWKVEIIDAGHLSVSDLCGLTDSFIPGCGEGKRQTKPGELFTYIPVKKAQAITKTWLGHFFGAYVRGEGKAADWLKAPPADDGTNSDMRLTP